MKPLKILITAVKVAEAAGTLEQLGTDLSDRKIVCSINKSSGALAESTVQLVEQLEALGSTFSLLCMQTSNSLRTINLRFEQEDTSVAGIIRSAVDRIIPHKM